MQRVNKIRVGELFAGIGGIGIGLESTEAFEVVWQVEKDSYANKILNKHWTHVRRWDDVRTFPPAGQQWDVDMITAGFPCTNISNAGKKEGIEGNESKLFYEVIRIAKELRPRWLILENVTTLLHRGMGEVLRSLSAIGFDVEWFCIRASDLGAWHRRDRIFFMCQRADAENDVNASRFVDGWVCDRCGSDVFNGCGCDQGEWVCSDCGEYTYPFYYSIDEGCQFCGSGDVSYAFGERGRSWSSWCKNAIDARQSSGRPQFGDWSIEPELGRVANGVPDRVHRLRCLGNAVCPPVAEYVGRVFLQRIGDDTDGE
jgi:DNA (cytosine-5)-methyltransferase 1